MSFQHYNERVKYTQSVIEKYIGTDLEANSHDPFTMVDSLRESFGLAPLFADIAQTEDDLAAYLSDKLPEIGTKSAIVGDVVAIRQDETYSLGIIVDHYYSLFLVANNKFGVVPNKHLTNAWRIGVFN